ncbi:conserved hypothetical protein [Histoplasma capsulatum var. duboisii H88]|uniref:DUF605 domain-containing protein n=2 Tax=Ajellomyces capsulatus TaxID=5037 RepID=F0ULF5_AJEC8|nr:conserved hypothetical protein [Histoplasma capsulatum H143]EGC46225.1 conserved hypothetical protein [Histoplasma capsulatum var. duboisii H88]QSS56845.1 DUF605 domain-containing protein [Histoplasma capsulatum var. duboisii H88]
MATGIPTKLKAADITRFVTRASQLEKLKPVISYWCNYWTVNQILSKGLHNTDGECLKYTTDLMDKLEKFKSEHADDDTVIDDAAGQAYVEQFGLETFQRADNAVRANKASLQTADTFQAAATFLELCQIWGPIDPETATKIKFAKYHALRIAKALKAGEDPNLSNPSMEEEEENLRDGPTLDPNDPEVQALNGSPSQSVPEVKLRQPSVEDVPDEFDSEERRLAQQSLLNESLHPSRVSSVPPTRRAELGNITAASSTGLPSPPTYSAGMVDLSSDPRQFPSNLSQALVPDLPAAPSDFPSPASSAQDLSSPGPGQPSERRTSLSTFQSFPVPTIQPGEPAAADLQGSAGSRTPPPPALEGWTRPSPPTATPPTSIQPTKPVHSISSYPNPLASQGVVDEDSIATAQKHARWAVSALNFDDVPTAIKELKNALSKLGAQ